MCDICSNLVVTLVYYEFAQTDFLLRILCAFVEVSFVYVVTNIKTTEAQCLVKLLTTHKSFAALVQSSRYYLENISLVVL